jgi:hypothetical protein
LESKIKKNMLNLIESQSQMTEEESGLASKDKVDETASIRRKDSKNSFQQNPDLDDMFILPPEKSQDVIEYELMD